MDDRQEVEDEGFMVSSMLVGSSISLLLLL
jgi:hypothetical protein